MHADLALALELADLADSITLAALPRRRSRRRDEARPDARLRGRPGGRARDPRAAGAATGRTSRSSARRRAATAAAAARWIVDPIDATKNYVRGIPVFATLIALERDGEIAVGVVSAPALGRRWWAARGEGAFADGRRLRVSQVARLEDAVLTYTSAADFFRERLGPQFEQLVRTAWAPRGYGDFWQYMLLAEGAVDVAVETVAELWDLAAPQVIVEEAGGRFTTSPATLTAQAARAWPRTACCTTRRWRSSRTGELVAAAGRLGERFAGDAVLLEQVRCRVALARARAPRSADEPQPHARPAAHPPGGGGSRARRPCSAAPPGPRRSPRAAGRSASARAAASTGNG